MVATRTLVVATSWFVVATNSAGLLGFLGAVWALKSPNQPWGY